MNTDVVDQTASAEKVPPAPYVQIISDKLAAAGHSNPTGWQNFLHPDAFITNDVSIQRFLINRCLSFLIGRVESENTMDVRYCLINDGEVERWVELLDQTVIPCMVRLNLPL
jgi:hypothetical protein